MIMALIVATLSATNALAVEDLHRILSARSSTELARRLTDQKREHRQDLVCDVQLKTGKLPLACFTVLHLETERRFASGYQETLASMDHTKWLVDLCASRAALSKDRIELKKALASRVLPEVCRKAVSLRAADLNYVDQSERPAELFRSRNSFGLN